MKFSSISRILTTAALSASVLLAVTAGAGATGDQNETDGGKTLTVTQVGNGAVQSNPAGITLSAPGTATATFDADQDDAPVTLSETPAAGWSFTGWTGDCTDQSSTCQVTMDQNHSVTATFTYDAPAPTPAPLVDQITVGQIGNGSVSSNGSGVLIDAPGSTSVSATDGTSITLSAAPASGNVFVDWTGACAGQGATCQLTATPNETTTAVFAPEVTTPTTPPIPTPATLCTVFFAENSYVVTSADRATLSACAQRVVQGDYTHVTLIASTDKLASARYNRTLSRERALAVETVLNHDLANAGGASVTVAIRPVGISLAHAGLASNRRVTVYGN